MVHHYGNKVVMSSSKKMNSGIRPIEWYKVESKGDKRNNTHIYDIPVGLGLEGTVLGDYLK